MVGLAQKAAQPDITHKLFKAQRIVVPSLADQRAKVERIEKLSITTEGISGLASTKLTYLENLKQSILQKAFSGELTASAEPMLQEAGL